jgi:hypothetical protein
LTILGQARNLSVRESLDPVGGLGVPFLDQEAEVGCLSFSVEDEPIWWVIWGEQLNTLLEPVDGGLHLSSLGVIRLVAFIDGLECLLVAFFDGFE